MNRALTLWTGFVLAFAALSYSLRFTEGKPPKDLLYKWVTVEGNLVQYAIIAAIVYGIAGVAGNRREVFALRAPTSWGTAARIGLGIGIFMIVLTRLLGPITPTGTRAGDHTRRLAAESTPPRTSQTAS